MQWSSWNPFKPFGRDQAEVERILEEVLAGSIDPREWGNFLDVPMNGTPLLEQVREACMRLENEETIANDGVVVYSLKGREELAQLLAGLREGQ